VSGGTPIPAESVPYADELLHKLWTTKAVRFEASKRLTERDHASRLSIAVLSVYVIGATVVELLLRLQHREVHPMLFSFVGVVAPVLIIVIEGHEGAKHYRVRADRMHRSAHQMQKLHDRLARLIKTSKVTLGDLETMEGKYHKIMDDFDEHHEDIDYATVRASHPLRFDPSGKKSGHPLLATWNRLLDIWAASACFVLLPAPFLVWAIITLLRT
jgi:SMODS and SLOG-associating 2TM effector domain family 5